MDWKLSYGELDAVAWDWVTFAQKTDAVFDFELFQRAYMYYGTETGALPELKDASEWCCLIFPTMVLPNQIFGYTNGGIAANQGRRLGLGKVAAERVYVDLNGDFPRTIQSARFDSGYAVITDSSCESLFVDGEVASLVFHLERPSKVLKPIRELHTCFLCGEVQRACDCARENTTASATALIQNLWKLAVGPGGTEPLRSDSWHRYASFLHRVCDYNLVDSISSVSTAPDAEQLGVVTPLREDAIVRTGVASSGPIVESMKRLFMERLLSQWYPTSRLVDMEAPNIAGSPPSSGPSTATRAIEAPRNTCVGGATCDVCGLEFARPSEQRRHFRVVHQEVREFHCEHCGKNFALRHHLQSHVAAVHLRQRDHPCHVCGKAFSTEAKVKRHRRCVHERERHLQCPSCDQAFFQRCDLERHRKRAHPGVPASRAPQEGTLEPFGSELDLAATVETDRGATSGHAFAHASGRSLGA